MYVHFKFIPCHSLVIRTFLSIFCIDTLLNVRTSVHDSGMQAFRELHSITLDDLRIGVRSTLREAICLRALRQART